VPLLASCPGNPRRSKPSSLGNDLSCLPIPSIALLLNAVRLQLHALAYNLANFLRTLALPQAIRRLVPDDLAGEGGQDRGKDRRPWPLSCVPDGRGGGAPGAVPGHPQPDRWGCARPSWRDVDPSGPPPSPGAGPTCARCPSEPRHPGAEAAPGAPSTGHASRFRSPGLTNRLQTCSRGDYAPSKRGLRPLHLGNVGSKASPTRCSAGRRSGCSASSAHATSGRFASRRRWSWRSPSRACSGARATPAAWRSALPASSVTGPTRAPPRPTPSMRSADSCRLALRTECGMPDVRAIRA